MHVRSTVEGGLTEILGGVPASQNPYPQDQNVRFSLIYLWPDQIFETKLSQTYPYNNLFNSDQC